LKLLGRGGARLAGCAVACATTLASPPLHADSTAPGGLRGLLHVRSADTAGSNVLEVGVFSAGHTLLDSTSSRHYFLVSDLQLGYGVSRDLEVGLDLPVRAWHVSRSADSRITPSTLGGFGDLVGSAKLQLPLPGGVVRLGGIASVTAPTGSKSRGFTTDSNDFEADGLLTIDLSHLDHFVPVRLHLNGGYRWNRQDKFGFGLARLDSLARGGFWPPAYPAVPNGLERRYNDVVPWRVGLEFSTRVLGLFTEFATDQYPRVRGLAWRDNPTTLTQGALLKFRNGLNIKGAVDLSIQKDNVSRQVPHLPDWRFALGVTWRRKLTLGDRDHDGIPDGRDKCPDQAEDFDGFQDDDGCPDLDNDGDGIPDKLDRCPDLAEDLDGFQDDDGCPDNDNDGDGIPDVRDKCPNEPEDFNGFQDTDGCPDAQLVSDRDGDGIPDKLDRCPDQAEDRDGFQDDDGCPDLDNDGDGIPDAQDKCPNEAETKNGYQDDDGCPDTAPAQQATVLEGLVFASGSAALPPGADALLEPFARELAAHPSLTLDVRAYTDDRGDAAANRRLSERRAQAVRARLLGFGVAPERVRARGLGAADPVAPNDTPEGRARNRRIEIQRQP
jgi:outer membrane protein OmpA-like peptidoglycan-associated protein